MDRKKVLWVFALKHRDGIASFLKGHVSQREDVCGRINDFIVYLFILRGMIEEDRAHTRTVTESSKGMDFKISESPEFDRDVLPGD